MKLTRGSRVFQSVPPELNLLGLNELTRVDRWVLERRCRALAQPLYLGDHVAICRVMGRYKLYVRTDDVGFGSHVLMDGLWESWLTVFMARIVRPGMHVVDAGANHGYYTVLFADLVGPKGKVAAFEPNPATAALLRRNVSVNGFGRSTHVVEAALAASDNESLQFFMPLNEPKNGRLVGPEWLGLPETVTVLAGKLDTLLGDWPRVDFLKIDVEGGEEAMLTGAWGIIERDRPRILLEFNATRCIDPDGLLDRLESLYGAINIVGFDSEIVPASRSALMDPDYQEDWLIYLSAN